MWISYICSFLLLISTKAAYSQLCRTVSDVCPPSKCRRIPNRIQCNGCHLPDLIDVCKILERFSDSCDWLDDEDESINCDDFEDEEVPFGTTQMTTSNSSNDNQTTVIVIAVCVSVVVVIIAGLIAGVYCWRVKRRHRKAHADSDLEMRNKSETNFGQIPETMPYSSRPDSTYNTINDLTRDHEYNTLEAQTPSNENVLDTDNGYHHTVEAQAPSNGHKLSNDDQEYNRINVKNRPPPSESDHSYSHLNTRNDESDYDGEIDTISRTSNYQYGVPIKITDKGKPLGGQLQTKDADNAAIGERTRSDEDQSADDDDYVIPRDEGEDLNNRLSVEALSEKPKAVVSPMNFDTDQKQMVNSSISIDNQRKSNASKSPDVDDYELAVIRADGEDNVKESGNTGIELPSVKLDSKQDDNPQKTNENITLNVDDYEVAVVKVKENVRESGISGIELPTVKIG